MGQAKFLRAFYYFWIVRLWGDAPLIVRPIFTWTDSEVTPPRASSQKIYDLIVRIYRTQKLLDFPIRITRGYASKIAVKSLMARVYLTMAGFPMSKGSSYYQLAAAKAKEVIDFAVANPAKIGLFPNYNDLHDPIQTQHAGAHFPDSVFGGYCKCQLSGLLSSEQYQHHSVGRSRHYCSYG